MSQGFQMEIRRKMRYEIIREIMLKYIDDMAILLDDNGFVMLCTKSLVEGIPDIGDETFFGKYVSNIFNSASHAEWAGVLLENYRNYKSHPDRNFYESNGFTINYGEETRHYKLKFITIEFKQYEWRGVWVKFIDTTNLYIIKTYEEQIKNASYKFLRFLSHELKTPMNAIKGMVHIAENTDDAEKIYYCIEKINEAANHLNGAVDDLLNLAEAENGEVESEMTEFSLEKFLNDIKNEVIFRVDEKNQTLTVNIDEDLPYSIISDRRKLEEIITNLLYNAIKFTSNGGAISLSAELRLIANDYCVIDFAVKDNGIGMAKETIDSLFNPFMQQEDARARRFGGVGMGLTVAKKHIDMLGGGIGVSSRVGEGSIFTFSIKASLGTKEKNEDEKYNFSGKRALLVDDNEINREVLLAMLSTVSIDVDCAKNGAEAIEIYSRNSVKYDIILMDVQMPVLDGHEAAKAIRSSEIEGSATIPIIAITANTFRKDIEQCKESGMNDFVAKPVDVDEINEKLYTYLNK